VRAFALFEDCREARFIARPNRFTLLLESSGRRLRAYLPNTGRLEEYTVEGGVFYVAASRTARFSHRAVAALSGGFPVLIDTRRINDLAEVLLREKALPGFEDFRDIGRERAVGGMRPDFTLSGYGGKTCLLEIKSCTLCHKGVALFPDAPSARASRHLEGLASARAGGAGSAMVFLVPHGGALRFMPNFHTDREFSERALSRSPDAISADAACTAFAGAKAHGVTAPLLRAYRVPLADAATADLDGVAEIPIDWDRVREHCTNAGSYALVLRSDEDRRLRVGRLGPVRFRKGYYVYVGSALGSLDARVARHFRRRKKRFWHIDAIAPDPMALERAYPIRRADRIESALVARMEGICDSPVEGFGASDSAEGSHLFYFARPPHRLRNFIDVILDFRTFTECVAFPDECR
jgi:sugar fermentation stimulation protein A